MEYWDLRLVSATYKTLPGEGIVVELYGHTKDGKSHCGPRPHKERG